MHHQCYHAHCWESGEHRISYPNYFLFLLWWNPVCETSHVWCHPLSTSLVLLHLLFLIMSLSCTALLCVKDQAFCDDIWKFFMSDMKRVPLPRYSVSVMLPNTTCQSLIGRSISCPVSFSVSPLLCTALFGHRDDFWWLVQEALRSWTLCRRNDSGSAR